MKTLETPRLILRKFSENDFSAVHNYASCFENIVYMIWGPNTEEQTRAFINMSISKANESPITNYQYAVESRDDHVLIGACNLFVSSDGGEAEIGWILSRNCWNRGYGTEMGKALLQFGFDELNLHKITAHCDAENIGSYRVMQKIGMRHEGLFIEGRAANKLSDKKYSDELSYAILRDEWETQKEIAYYTSLSATFDDFMDFSEMELFDGIIRLICTAKNPAVPERKYVPSYDFAICKGGEKIGAINLRVGYSGFGPDLSSLYYGGHIGYGIAERHRGNGYAANACRLLSPVAKAHDMKKLLITNDCANTASRRVCEKLGARLIRLARLPEWHPRYSEGRRFSNIFEWNVE